MFSNRTKTLAQPDTTRHKGAVLAIWESANIDFICFINKEVNHRHRKSRPGGLFSNLPRPLPITLLSGAWTCQESFLDSWITLHVVNHL